MQPDVARFDAPSSAALPVTIAPPIARAGSNIQITVAGDNLGSCTASVAGGAAVCANTATGCSCTYLVTASLADGTASVTVSTATASGSGSVIIDSHPPVIDLAHLSILRLPITEPDALHIETGAIVDPAPNYEGQGVSSVRIWADPSDNSPIATTSAVAQDFPVGTATQSPTSLWVSAVDAAGNESNLVQVQTGDDVDGPVIDGTLFTLHLNPVGEDDFVEVAAGAISDASAIYAFGVYQSDGQRVADLPANANGIDSIDLGDVTTSTLFIAAVDKERNLSDFEPIRHVIGTFNCKGRVAQEEFPALAFYYDSEPQALPVPHPNRASLRRAESTNYSDSLAAQDGAGVLETAGDSARGATTWTDEGASDTMPPRVYGTLTYDVANEQIVMFGGADDSHFLNDLWAYDAGTHAWTAMPVAAGSPLPVGRISPMLAFDTARQRLVMFGGDSGEARACGGDFSACNDLWEFDGSQWQQISTPTQISPRHSAAMAYDAFLQRVVMFGGESDDPNCDGTSLPHFCSGTWAYDGVDWQRVPSVLAPSPRVAASLVYNSIAGTLLLYGGTDSGHSCEHTGTAFCDGVWQLAGNVWSMLSESAAPLANQFYPPLAFDDVNGQLLVAAPNDANTPTNTSTWALISNVWTVQAATTTTVLLWPAGEGGQVIGGFDPTVSTFIIYDGATGHTWQDAVPYSSHNLGVEYFKLAVAPIAHLNTLTFKASLYGLAGASAGLQNSMFYNWTFGFWENLANNSGSFPGGTSYQTYAGSDTFSISIVQVSDYMLNGVIWARVAGGASTGTLADGPNFTSVAATDYIEMTVDYSFPPR